MSDERHFNSILIKDTILVLSPIRPQIYTVVYCVPGSAQDASYTRVPSPGRDNLKNHAHFQMKKLEVKLPRVKRELCVRAGLESRFSVTAIRNNRFIIHFKIDL